MISVTISVRTNDEYNNTVWRGDNKFLHGPSLVGTDEIGRKWNHSYNLIYNQFPYVFDDN